MDREVLTEHLSAIDSSGVAAWAIMRPRGAPLAAPSAVQVGRPIGRDCNVAERAAGGWEDSGSGRNIRRRRIVGLHQTRVSPTMLSETLRRRRLAPVARPRHSPAYHGMDLPAPLSFHPLVVN